MKNVLIGLSFVIVFVVVFLLSRPSGLPGESGGMDGGSTVSAGGASNGKGDEMPAGKVDFSGLSASEYQAAWDAVPAMKLGKSARGQLQQAILTEWAARDIRAAAKAAFGEAWDDRYGPSRQSLESHLATAFGEIFRGRPDEVWEMIAGDEFGILESAVMRSAWVESLMSKDPKMLLPYLVKLDRENQIVAISSLASRGGKESLVQLWSSLRGQEALSNNVGGFLASRTSAEFSRAEILALINEGGASGKLATAALAEQVSRQPVTAESLKLADRLPEETRSSFVFSLMKQESSDPEFARQGIEMLMEAEAWSFLNDKEVSEKVRLFAAETPPADLAAWAVSLPQREEAARLFHRGVEPFIRSDPDLAWEWIEEFDEGMWRDRAYAEFSQQALNHFNDPAKSEEALGKISNPAFQKEAWSWRRGWENKTGFRRGQ